MEDPFRSNQCSTKGISVLTGFMDRNITGGLINSISRLIHLVACQNGRAAVLKDFRIIVGILKLLRPVIDEVFESQNPSDEQLIQAFVDLDLAVNEAREFMEKRPQRMSMICSVLQSEPMVLKIQKSSLDICHVLSQLLQSASFSSHSVNIQHCMQEIQCAVQDDLISELIEVALKDQRENVIPSLEDIIKIIETLGLRSNQELLTESIALEKERTRAELKGHTEDVDRIDQIIVLVTHIRYCIAKLEQFGVKNGLPIPSYFRCPLSMELMLDPVILASGQTYERPFVQKWLDSGLRICPKTRQTLAHTDLITNYTVKAMIATWCEENNIRLYNSLQPECVSNPILSSVAREDSSPGNSSHCSMHRDSISKSSAECINPSEQQRSEVSSGCCEESFLVIRHQRIPNKDTLQGSILLEQQNYCHSPSESISSVISSIEISTKFEEKVGLFEVTKPSSTPSNKELVFSPLFPPNQICSSDTKHKNSARNHSFLPGLGPDDLTTSSHVQKLMEDLKSQAPEVQTEAASEFRLLAKHNMENRVLIGKCGVIPLLISLLYSKIKMIQENSVTALLNLSINDDNKILIAEAGAMEPLIHVLESGSIEAQENSAATLFSLSVLEEYKIKIGRSGAVKALVNLLGFGSLRGKKDAATALFNLSIFHENKARIVQAGAVRYLIELLDPSTSMVDKSVALLANLSTIPEGRQAIVQEGGIPLLVEIVEMGSQRGKENAASVLLQLCTNSQKFCNLVLQEGAVPPLIALSQFGTPRAKEKAQQILSHFRSQREGTVRKAKS